MGESEAGESLYRVTDGWRIEGGLRYPVTGDPVDGNVLDPRCWHYGWVLRVPLFGSERAGVVVAGLGVVTGMGLFG